MIKHCIDCGSKLKKGHKFCRECGAEIPEKIPENIKHCPYCGNKIQEDHMFCDECGFEIVEPKKELTETTEDPEIEGVEKTEDPDELDIALSGIETALSEKESSKGKKNKTKSKWLPLIIILIVFISVAGSAIFLSEISNTSIENNFGGSSSGGSSDSSKGGSSNNHKSSTKLYKPTAHFTCSISDNKVYFTDKSNDKDGSIKNYNWDFGDGTSSSSRNPTHTYQNSGTYTVKLTVTDDDGKTDSYSKSISIIVPNIKPNAYCSATPTRGTIPLTVSFTGSGTDADGYISNYYWDFGDGNTSSQSSPSHTFTTSGTYYVSFTVTDDDEATDSETITITTYSGPITVTFKPIDDASSSGDLTYMEVRNNDGFLSSGHRWNGYIKFPISNIPSGSNIKSASLHLYYWNWRDNDPSGRKLNLHRIWGHSWNEETITEYSPGWVGTITDYAIIPSYTNTWMEWEVTEDVQDFIDGEETNYGWVITDDTSYGWNNIPISSFRSKEYNSQYAPYISITYTP
jgi:PKD repeat protein